ncbi:MAG: glycosyltransferase family 4 protein [Nitrospira sp.]
MAEFKIMFLMPLVYRPQEEAFAERFVRLSERCSGHIFSAGFVGQCTVGGFKFHGGPIRQRLLARFFSRLWIQIFYPIIVMRGQEKPNVVIAYDPYASGLAGVVLKWYFGSKLIVEMNGDYHEAEPADIGIKKRIMRRVLAFSLGNADGIKVLNASQERYVRTVFPQIPVFKYPNLVAVNYFRGLEAFQGDYLLAIGYPFKLKGMDVVIKAFREIEGKHPGVKLRIMGYCPEPELTYYRELAGGSSRIEFVKPAWIKEVGEQMRCCYGLVHAARSEAMGRVQLEAMACRKPIVTSRTNGGKECVDDGVTGFQCAINDIHDLAGKMDLLLSDPDRARAMGQAGSDRLDRMFSSVSYFVAFYEMLRKILGR